MFKIFILILISMNLWANEQPITNAMDLSNAQKNQLSMVKMAYEKKTRSAVSYLSEYFRENSLKKCESQYQDLMNQEIVSVFISLGYLNGNLSIVEDRIAHESLVKILTRPCLGRSLSQPNDFLIEICGFTQASALFDKDGLPTKLEKNITGPHKAPKKVILEIQSSSIDFSDYNNKNAYKFMQESQSFNSWDQYFSALGRKNVVMYIGHSRGGGGPDFSPPKLKGTANLQKIVNGDMVDYEYYKHNQDGLKQMIDTLRLNPGHAKVIGIFSCDSTDHFFNQLDQVLDPSTMLLLTKKETTTPIESMLIGLNGVLSLQCEDQISSLMNRFDGEVKRPY